MEPVAKLIEMETKKNGNECSSENVWESFLCARATYHPICGTLVLGHAKDAAKVLEKCKLRASNG